MRRNIFLLAILISCIPAFAYTQTTIDDEGFEIFEMQEGDTTYTMKKYYFCLLMPGENRTHGAEEVSEIQAGHMAHLSSVAEQRKACIIGPFNGSEEYSGIVVYNTKTKEEAEELAGQDPAVKAGRLKFQIIEWWAAKGTALY